MDLHTVSLADLQAIEGGGLWSTFWHCLSSSYAAVGASIGSVGGVAGAAAGTLAGASVCTAVSTISEVGPSKHDLQ
jgi:hypothetical protein